MIREAPGEPALTLTWLGDEKMPEPMIKPTISDRPLRYVKVLCFSNDPPPRAPVGLLAEAEAPIGAYPAPVVDDSGKRFEVKSKLDVMEKELFARPLGAGLELSNGSSCSRESFRDEDMLGRESVSFVLAPGLELARDASSSESRASGCRFEE